MRPDGAAGKGGMRHQHRLGRRDDRLPRHPDLLGHQVRVDRLTRVAAMESGKLGYGVRVNCIYPGLVPTAMGAGLANDVAAARPLRLPGGGRRRGHRAHPARAASARSSDMADAVVFLASDASRFVNGVGLPVDGGMGM